jgi:cell division septation protein DedD
MNIPIPSTVHTVNDFVFRSADRMRIAGCANAVAREGLSLALFCEHEALLDHYLNLMLAQLRQQAPEHSIEVYFPANTDSLLARFNEVLAQQSVQQATRASKAAESAQIWIVHDAHTLPEAEVQLLARLIQNFPGANIRAILLMSGAKRQNITLTSFGRKLLRWDIEAPNSEQVQAALELASSEGRSGPLIQMLKRMDHPAVAVSLNVNTLVASMTPEPEAAPSASSSFKQTILGWHQHGQAKLQSLSGLTQSNPPRAWVKQPKMLALLLIPALMLSVFIMLLLQPQSFGLKTPTTRVVKSQDAAPPIAAVAPAAPATASTPVAVSTPVSPPGPSAASQPAPQPVPGPTAQPSPASTGPNPQPASSATDIRQTQTWIKDLDPQSFLVQYGTSKTYDKALELLKSLTDIKTIAIVEAYHTGDSVAHFVIVSGPYAQVNDGLVAARKPGIPNGSWVRPTRSLQTQIKTALPKQDTPR